MIFVREPLVKIRTSAMLSADSGIWRKNSSTMKIPASVVSKTSNTKDSVSPHFQTPRRKLKIGHVAEYFLRA